MRDTPKEMVASPILYPITIQGISPTHIHYSQMVADADHSQGYLTEDFDLPG